MATGLARIIAAEQARVAAGEPGCGYACPNHPVFTCVRLAHPDVAGDRVPHVSDTDPDTEGGLVQWTGGCPEGDDVATPPSGEPDN